MKRSAIALTFCVAALALSYSGSGPRGTADAGRDQPQQDAVTASGLLQKCLGITPGADQMAKGPATRQYCQQLPVAGLFDQAGERFQAGDHARAAQIVSKAACFEEVQA